MYTQSILVPFYLLSLVVIISGTPKEVDLLAEIGLKRDAPLSRARVTFGPNGKLGAFFILQDIRGGLKSEEWRAVANSFPQGFALHVNVFPRFDYVGILLSINQNTNMEFTVAFAPESAVFGKQNLVIKLPGLDTITYLIPEVQEEWIRLDLVYRDDMLSLYRNCQLIARQILLQKPSNISRLLVGLDDTLYLPDAITVYSIMMYDTPGRTLLDCSSYTSTDIDFGSGGGIIEPFQDKGEKGAKGDPGDVGPMGQKGEQGTQGANGETGPPGPVGEKGAKGDDGKIGARGEPGHIGLKGDKGEIGLAGMIGPKGEKGESGKFCSLKNSTETDLHLPICEEILKGPQGDVGRQGLGGQKGMKGDSGLKGQKGDAGRMGNPGKDGRPGEFPAVNELINVICEQAEITGNITLKMLCAGQATGPPGPKGDAGFPGEMGLRGFPGTPGRNGTTGSSGEKGEKGDTGEIGMLGSKGEPGNMGGKGEKGTKGEQGLPGNEGVAGSDGEKGQKGEMGAIGRVGDKGQKGTNGTEGPPGVDGISIKGIKGEKGNSGGRGPPGRVQALKVAGVPGQKGQIGEKGSRGFLGPKGLPGPPGLKGSLGDPGPMGMSGSRGARGPLGPPGPPGFGLKGDKGDMGPSGKQGEPGNRVVPTVTSLSQEAAPGQMVLLKSLDELSLNVYTDKGWMEIHLEVNSGQV